MSLACRVRSRHRIGRPRVAPRLIGSHITTSRPDQLRAVFSCCATGRAPLRVINSSEPPMFEPSPSPLRHNIGEGRRRVICRPTSVAERPVWGRNLWGSSPPSGGRRNSSSPSAVCTPASPYRTWGCSWPSRYWSDPRHLNDTGAQLRENVGVLPPAGTGRTAT